METNTFLGRANVVFEWIMRLAYLNLLWLIFTLVGFVVFGFMPATAAMFTVVRKWVMGDSDVRVFKVFWESYKKEFIKINLLGLILLIIGYILYFDFIYFQSMDGLFFVVLTYFFLTLFFTFLLILLYIFPVFVHYDLKAFQYIKKAFLIAVSNPFSTVIMVTGGLVVYYLLLAFPGLIPFFSGSFIACILMWPAYRTFTKKQRKLEEHQ